jgi:hypothetical protein
VKNSPVYSHIDDAINNAYLLSDLRKPSKIITKTNEDGQAQKKSRYTKLSPILFVQIQHSTGKKNRQTKNKLVKARVPSSSARQHDQFIMDIATLMPFKRQELVDINLVLVTSRYVLSATLQLQLAAQFISPLGN